MNIVVLLGWFFLRIESVTATQCLSCAPMPSSVPCITTRNCQSGQECYAKYAMKHDGTVMYEFGCHNSQTCPGQMGTHALIGKRATGDIELCYKCCQGDMCNQGTICTATPPTPSPSTTMSTTTAPATPVNPCSPSPCVHGSCFISSANPVTFFCMCPRGFEGVHCETIITSTASASTYTLPTATVITTMLAPTNVITTSSQTTVITTIVAPTSVISTSSPTTGGDVCLACVDSPVTRACHYTRTCESHESCYADAFENQNGDTIFDMGCRDKQLCGSSGKREMKNRSNGNTLLCTKCCSGNICNSALCGQTGLPSVGPVCFHCDQASSPSTCNTIALCGRDDICYVEQFIDDLSHATLYKSGCLHKIQCDKHAHSLSLIGRKRYDNTVLSGNDLQIKCCDSTLCNNGNTNTTLGSPVTSGTVVPTHGSQSTIPNFCSSSPCMHGNCFSGSADYFCQCEQGWQSKNCDQRQGKCTTHPCVHGNCFESSIDYVCQCENGWEGKNCDVALPANDCSDLLSRNSIVRSGTFYITTPVTHTQMQVFCDMETDGGGWTVFQKRFNGREDFHRNFRDYENGFGNVYAEHWLGLKYIQEITSAGKYILRLDVTYFNGSKGYDVYDKFRLQHGTDYTLDLGSRLMLSGIQPGYQLNIDKSVDTGNALGCAFSTYDHDVDVDPNASCAGEFQGGWWYNSCYLINLNGLYLPGLINTTAMCFSYDVGLTSSTMMFKKT